VSQQGSERAQCGAHDRHDWQDDHDPLEQAAVHEVAHVSIHGLRAEGVDLVDLLADVLDIGYF
jgi:hypothetical protein